jgi:hypothetical protein
VLKLSGAVPVAVAGAAAVALDEDEEVDPLDDVLVPPDRTLCIAAVSWVLTRSSAVLFAMLARPLPRLVSADDIALMIDVVALMVLSFDWAWFQ